MPKPPDERLFTQMTKDFKIVNPARCSKCGKPFGLTNGTIYGCAIWMGCDCMDKNTIYLINESKENFRVSIPDWIENIICDG